MAKRTRYDEDDVLDINENEEDSVPGGMSSDEESQSDRELRRSDEESR